MSGGSEESRLRALIEAAELNARSPKVAAPGMLQAVQPSIDQSLMAANRALSHVETLLDGIYGDLTGEGGAGADEASGPGSIRYMAGRIARRAESVADRLENIRAILTTQSGETEPGVYANQPSQTRFR